MSFQLCFEEIWHFSNQWRWDPDTHLCTARHWRRTQPGTDIRSSFPQLRIRRNHTDWTSRSTSPLKKVELPRISPLFSCIFGSIYSSIFFGSSLQFSEETPLLRSSHWYQLSLNFTFLVANWNSKHKMHKWHRWHELWWIEELKQVSLLLNRMQWNILIRVGIIRSDRHLMLIEKWIPWQENYMTVSIWPSI